MRRLNVARTQELAGWMENMLQNPDKETLTAEYIPQGQFDMNVSLVRDFAIGQVDANRDPNIL